MLISLDRQNGAIIVVSDGAQMFLRYAYPPNSYGYCGPADSTALFQYGAAAVTDPGLVQLAKGFAGAWPYLELIAGGSGIPDPLDPRVVEAYWVGTPLLEKLSFTEIGNSMEARFRARSGSEFKHLVHSVNAGGVPHHNFHVFHVYPWIGLLGDHRKAATALDVLDNCRIRWGRIESVVADEAVIRSCPLAWDGLSLSLGEERLETARVALDGTGFLADLGPGDVVSLHWDWVCDRLSSAQLGQLRHYTDRHLRIVNTGVKPSGSALPLS